jgi:hypothetical protein
MNDQPRGPSGAPDWGEAGETTPVAVKPRSEEAAPPLRPPKPLMMMPEEEAGYCTGDACVIPVRNDRGEGQ